MMGIICQYSEVFTELPCLNCDCIYSPNRDSPMDHSALLHCGISRAEWHDKAWALYHARTFDDVALGKLSIHTIRAVFDATYDALKTPNFEGKQPAANEPNKGND